MKNGAWSLIKVLNSKNVEFTEEEIILMILLLDKSIEKISKYILDKDFICLTNVNYDKYRELAKKIHKTENPEDYLKKRREKK